MIIELQPDYSDDALERLLKETSGYLVSRHSIKYAVVSSQLKTVPDYFAPFCRSAIACKTDVQLGSREFEPKVREVMLGPIVVGGNSKNTAVIAGPCSVESEEQIRTVAKVIKEQGLKILRAGCFKPRTSPYSFQGLGKQGLLLLAMIREEFGLSIITEVRDSTHVDDVIETADIIQIGAKAMYDHGILNACGQTTKPVLLKRGFGTTLQEFMQAAEFVMSRGNFNVVLCERGIRTFETKTRFTLDLCGVEFLKEQGCLPVIVDPSHAMGFAYGVSGLARAAVALSVEGVLVEVHPNPSVAKSDASQQMDLESWSNLLESLKPIAYAVGRRIA